MSQSKTTSQETLLADPMIDLINKLNDNDEFLDFAHQFGLLSTRTKTFAHLCFQRVTNGCQCLMCGGIVPTTVTYRMTNPHIQHYIGCQTVERKRELLKKIVATMRLENNFTTNEVYHDIIKLFNNNSIPLNVYGSAEFREFVRKYLKIDLNSLSWFRDYYLKTIRKENSIMEEEFTKDGILGISTAVDLWSVKRGSCSFIGIVVSTIDNNFERKVHALTLKYMEVSHTHENVKEIVRKELVRLLGWEIMNVVKFYVTDGGLLGAFDSIYCNCHCLQKALEWALKDDLFQKIAVKPFEIEKLIRINNLEIWSNYVNECNELNIYPLKLITQSPTRWDNLSLALRVIKKQYQTIKKCLENIFTEEYMNLKETEMVMYRKEEYVKTKISSFLMSEDELDNYIQVLSAIEKANCEFSASENVTIDNVLRIYLDLRNQLLKVLRKTDGIATEVCRYNFMKRYDEQYKHVKTPKPHYLLQSYSLLFRFDLDEHEEILDEVVDILKKDDKGKVITSVSIQEKYSYKKPYFKIDVQKTSVQFIPLRIQQHISEIGIFIIRMLGLLDYRINRIFYDPIYVIPIVLNPRYFGKKLSHNPIGYFYLDYFMRMINVKVKISPKGGISDKMYEDDQGSFRSYKTMQPSNFVEADYIEIYTVLSRQTVTVEESLTVEAELSKLWNSSATIMDSLEYFKQNANVFPRISIIARLFLVNFSSESVCERMFSQAGIVVTKRRNKMSNENAEQLVLNKINSPE
ncbi:hAT transposon family protein [Methanobrevibacter sp.]